MKPSKEILTTIGFLWLRILMGIGIATHGYSKIFSGEELGEGVRKLAGYIESMGLPLPYLSAWLAAISEFLGGILIAIGFGTRISALFVFITMTVAAFIAHKSDPFAKKELALAYWTIAGALILTGPGIFSLDGILWKKKKQ